MHYNLGVFYTKNKEYPRAIAEFEKSIELNPEDPYAHFNLGYIYAEYLVDRPKAIVNFRKYLSLLKTDDKDADWVKKYILTWQTWEGKKPIE
jgi:tetratricopeptide (TPR) repeat protein